MAEMKDGQILFSTLWIFAELHLCQYLWAIVQSCLAAGCRCGANHSGIRAGIRSLDGNCDYHGPAVQGLDLQREWGGRMYRRCTPYRAGCLIADCHNANTL